MARGINKVILVGTLGRDPEMRYTAAGKAIANTSLATNESWKDKNTGEKQERTEWHRIVVWGKLAELCNQYLTKGRQAFVEGTLQTRSWDDKSGQKRYTTEINAKTVQFIGGASAGAGAGASKDNGGAPTYDSSMVNQEYDISTDTNFTSDDIPF